MQNTGSKKMSVNLAESRKKTARKQRRKKTSKNKITLPIKKILIWLILLGLFLSTIGAVGYVIFFRTVIAADVEFKSVVTERATYLAKNSISTKRSCLPMVLS
jgi:hypothetical protein